jgi:hypothetical protein
VSTAAAAKRPSDVGMSGVERVTRIELALSAWEADVLPLNYTRLRSAACQLWVPPADATCPDIVPDAQDRRGLACSRPQAKAQAPTVAPFLPGNGKLPGCCSLIAISRPRWNRAASSSTRSCPN